MKSFYNYSLSTINALVKLIWDASLEKLEIYKHPDFGINAYIAYEEMKTFSVSSMLADLVFSENVSKFTRISDNSNPDQIIECLNEAGFKITNDNKNLSSIYLKYKLNFPLNIDDLLEYMDKDDNISPNMQRLVRINQEIKQEKCQDFYYKEEFLESIYKKAKNYREKKGSKFPARLILLVEGITEEKLLPVFADKAGINFDEKGIYLIAAGGKNQSARLYKRFINELNIPVLILLDADAVAVAGQISKTLRSNDKIYLLPNGEFEDILPIDLICRTLNSYYRLTASVSPVDFARNCKRVTLLENLWKEKGFGEFNKAEFAKIIAENIKDKNDISESLNQAFSIIKGMM